MGSSSNGLYHVHDGFADHYSTTDGLTGKNIMAFYEDMEGNMWVATEQGLDCFETMRSPPSLRLKVYRVIEPPSRVLEEEAF